MRAPLIASLAAGFVALQFHFVTLDSGALISVLLGALAGTVPTAATSARSRNGSGSQSLWARVLASAAAVALSVLAIAAAGLVAADARVGAGFAAARAGDWATASAAFDAAKRFAPWEPAIEWAKGRAAVTAVSADRGDSLEDGREALARAVARLPGDARPLRDLGDLEAAAAVAGLPAADWSAAHTAYDAALALSPLDPRALLGRGVAEAGLGRAVEAERDLLRVVALAPEFADGWMNLAALYDSLGRTGDAGRARARAASLLSAD